MAGMSSWIGHFLIAILGFVLGNISRDEGLSLRWDAQNERALEGGLQDDSILFVTVITTIVIVIILVTIAFQVSKDYLLEKASHKMKPIVNEVFTELTILGFLSIIVYVVSKFGFFNDISWYIFGDRSTLIEFFDFVHYTIFFVMILFVSQIYVLVREALRIEKMWLQMDKVIRNERVASAVDQAEEEYYHKTLSVKHKRFNKIREMKDLIPGIRKKSDKGWEDLVLFKNLRDEFIRERSLEPPFAEAPLANQVSHDFNFGKYLSICMSNMLVQIIEVNVSTLMVGLVCAVVYYMYMLAVGANGQVLAWTWVVFAWSIYCFNIYFEYHLTEVRRVFAKKELFKKTGEPDGLERLDSQLVMNESTWLNYDVFSDGSLPLWTEVDLDKYMEQRSWFLRKFVGGYPNRQQTFYWMDRKGPRLYTFILQGNLLFLGIYFAVNTLSFFSVMYEVGLAIFIIYLILAILPFCGLLFFKQNLIALMAEVCCLGAYRRPNVVTEVLRDEKTAHVVRAFLVIHKLRVFAQDTFTRNHTHDTTPEPEDKLTSGDSFDENDLRDVEKTFDAFDTSGDGAITPDELDALMKNLGANMRDESIADMINILDEDGDGRVTKNEFIDWYAHTSQHSVGHHERAKYLFRMFDTKDTGELTIGEFKSKLDALNVGFSIDEIGAIVNELNEGNNGAIGLHEFSKLLKKYHPEELKAKEEKSRKARRSKWTAIASINRFLDL